MAEAGSLVLALSNSSFARTCTSVGPAAVLPSCCPADDGGFALLLLQVPLTPEAPVEFGLNCCTAGAPPRKVQPTGGVGGTAGTPAWAMATAVSPARERVFLCFSCVCPEPVLVKRSFVP